MNPNSLAHPARPILSVRGLLEVATLLGLASTAVAFAGSWHWLPELLTHGRFHLLVALAGMSAVWMLQGRRAWAAAAGLGAALNLLPIFHAHNLGLAPVPLPAQRGFRILSINVHTLNPHTDRVLACIRQIDPDVVLLMEVDDRWMQELAPLTTTYPFLKAAPRSDPFGIGLWSRVPWARADIVVLGEAGVPSVAVTVEKAGRQLHLFGTHPLPPASAEYARLRNDQLHHIAVWARGQTGSVLVVGDLNVTPTSPAFRQLVRTSGLRPVRHPPGRGTWPAFLPLGRIPIDHVLVTPDLQILRFELGPPVGADHLPIWVELKWP